jgi:hypothetical protein
VRAPRGPARYPVGLERSLHEVKRALLEAARAADGGAAAVRETADRPAPTRSEKA